MFSKNLPLKGRCLFYYAGNVAPVGVTLKSK